MKGMVSEIVRAPLDSPLILMLSVLYALVEAIRIYDVRLLQAERGRFNSKVAADAGGRSFPAWVTIFHWGGWLIFLSLLYLNWKYSIALYALLFVLRVVPVLENLGSMVMRPFLRTNTEFELWAEGFNAFETGSKHYKDGNTEEALKYFDSAVECGYEDSGLYSLRGSCLDELEWHMDAIADFDKAIALDAEDCNTYFQRALSKRAVGDEEGSLVEFRKAIELSEIDNQLNRSYNAGALEMGWSSVTMIYQAQLMMPTPDVILNRNRERARLKGRRKDEDERS